MDRVYLNPKTSRVLGHFPEPGDTPTWTYQKLLYLNPNFKTSGSKNEENILTNHLILVQIYAWNTETIYIDIFA